jgi:hypothetical protein
VKNNKNAPIVENVKMELKTGNLKITPHNNFRSSVTLKVYEY